MFRKILLLITPSGMCEHAADLAVSLVEQHQSHLFVLCMMQTVQTCWDYLFDRPAPEDAAQRGQELAAYFRGRLSNAQRCSVETSCGFTEVEAQRFAWRLDADLIVAGFDPKASEAQPAGRGAQTDLLSRLCQGARCPVLIVSRPVAGLPPAFARIVVATDFSHEAEQAVSFASRFAKASGARISVLHAVPSSPAPRHSALEALRLDLKARYSPDASREEIDHLDIRAGEPRLTIAEYAQNQKADLIVIGHRRKEQDPERPDPDSVLAYLTSHAPCPTLSVNRGLRA